MDDDPLWLDAKTMRQLGYRTVDLLVERLADPSVGPVNRGASREEMEARIAAPPPERPESFDAILGQLSDDVLPFMSRCEHPGYFAFIPACGTWPAALGDLLASALNIYAGAWLESAGPSQVELTVLDWFKEWIGYPPEAAGVLVSGGSAANITALACAREALLGAMTDRVVAYVSDQAHSSMARACRVLGFRPDQVRVLPVDAQYRLRTDTVAAAMDADVRSGRQPLFVSANAGSTNTGAIDPLRELAGVCRDRGVWLHVDAAYGGFAALTDRGRRWLEGVELADSVTLDPHKWLYQPFECGSLLVREGWRLRDAFEITPDYLKDAEIARREVNFADLGIQLTRMSRAMKLWMSLKYFGVSAFRAAIDRCLDLTEAAARRIEESPDLELMTPPSLGIVCFRRRVPGADDVTEARVNADLMASLNATGRSFMSSTRLRGRLALRLCVMNHTTGQRNVDEVLEWIERTPVVGKAPAAAGVQPSRQPAAPGGYDRNPEVNQGWLGRPPMDPETIRALPVFAGLSDAEVERVARACRERTVRAGQAVVRQWEATREFFVMLDGTAEVRTEDRHLDDIGPGDFFGELAAMEWGASFAYPRLASVIATSDLRVLVIPGARFTELVRETPAFAARIRRAVQERLPRL